MNASLRRARRLANRNFATVFYVDDGGVLLLSGRVQASIALDGAPSRGPYLSPPCVFVECKGCLPGFGHNHPSNRAPSRPVRTR